MNLTIKKQDDNTLLGRKEVLGSIIFEGKITPSRKELQDAFAKQLKVKPELLIIQQIKTSFGEATATITAHVYETQEALIRLERKNLLEKHSGYEPKVEEKEE